MVFDLSLMAVESQVALALRALPASEPVLYSNRSAPAGFVRSPLYASSADVLQFKGGCGRYLTSIRFAMHGITAWAIFRVASGICATRSFTTKFNALVTAGTTRVPGGILENRRQSIQ